MFEKKNNMEDIFILMIALFLKEFTLNMMLIIIIIILLWKMYKLRFMIHQHHAISYVFFVFHSFVDGMGWHKMNRPKTG